jgi:hypothetical protein
VSPTIIEQYLLLGIPRINWLIYVENPTIVLRRPYLKEKI